MNRRAPKPFASRYPGVCAVTGQAFPAGTRIVRAAGGWQIAPPAGTVAPRRPAAGARSSYRADARYLAARAEIDAQEDAREHRKASFVGADDPVPDHVLADYASDHREPPPGSWAEVARMMAADDTSGEIDWDSWKDMQKEADL